MIGDASASAHWSSPLRLTCKFTVGGARWRRHACSERMKRSSSPVIEHEFGTYGFSPREPPCELCHGLKFCKVSGHLGVCEYFFL